jgi:hypothetical protein
MPAQGLEEEMVLFITRKERVCSASTAMRTRVPMRGLTAQ